MAAGPTVPTPREHGDFSGPCRCLAGTSVRPVGCDCHLNHDLSVGWMSAGGCRSGHREPPEQNTAPGGRRRPRVQVPTVPNNRNQSRWGDGPGGGPATALPSVGGRKAEGVTLRGAGPAPTQRAHTRSASPTVSTEASPPHTGPAAQAAAATHWQGLSEHIPVDEQVGTSRGVGGGEVGSLRAPTLQAICGGWASPFRNYPVGRRS